MFNKYNILDKDVYIYDLNNNSFDTLKEYLFKYLTKEEQEKICRYKNEDDKMTHLVSYVLPKIHLSKLLNINPIDITILREEGKRPRYKDYDYYFSISHSNKYVGFVFDKENISLDIEERQKRDLKALRFVASKEEIEECSDFDSFYELWTFKEAYAKYYGKSLSRELISVNRDNIDLETKTIFINHLVITLIK